MYMFFIIFKLHIRMKLLHVYTAAFLTLLKDIYKIS